VYALLIRDAATWEKLYLNAYHGDAWGTRRLQLILRHLGYADATESGYVDSGTTKATKTFQADNGLARSGSLDVGTRKALFLAYMDAICQKDGLPCRYRPQDFVSRGSSSDWKGACQGCSEFNPVMVFSKIEDKLYSKSGAEGARNAENASNRRIVIYMFRTDRVPSADAWPCPTIKEYDQGIKTCKKHFWPDGETRRSPQDSRREYLNGTRTMACAFYDSLARGAPSEGVCRTVNITLLNRDGKWAKNVPYRVESNADVRTGFTNDFGRLQELQFYSGPTINVEWGYTKDCADKQGQPQHYGNFAVGYINTTDEDADAERVNRELYNLGYDAQDQCVNRRNFANEYVLTDSSDGSVHQTHQLGPEKASHSTDPSPTVKS
jgi:hypothetical protein